MPTFKSEINAIIAQIRAGSNDPELLADALQAIVESTPYGSAYYELTGFFFSRGPNLSPDFTLVKNTFPFDWRVVPQSGVTSDFVWWISSVAPYATVFQQNPELEKYRAWDFTFVSGGDAFTAQPNAFLNYNKEESIFDSTVPEIGISISNTSLVDGAFVHSPVGDTISFSLKLWRK